MTAQPVQFFFDPMCPYAYQTSVWIRTVRAARPADAPLDITWRFFSLEDINREEGKKHPWERPWSYGWGQMRVGALIRRRHGNEALDAWYEAVGAAFFEDGRKTFDPDVHAQVIEAIGFDPSIVDEAITDSTTSDDVQADYHDGVASYGAHGVPTLVFESGYAVYGPVIVPAPTGEEATALWDYVEGMQRFPNLFELRHPKTAADLGLIANEFSTYLNTRAWRTIENPAP